MPHLFPLHAQILLEAILRRHFSRYPLGHAHAGRFQRRHLLGIVRDQPHRLHAHRAQDTRGQLKSPAVRVKPKLKIGLNRVQSLILQFVGAQLRHQPDAAPLLLLVDQNACARLDDLVQRQLQLQTAIAPQRVEHIARQALRMNAHQRGRRVDIAHHQGHSLFALRRRPTAVARCFRILRALKAENAEVSPPRGKIRVRNLAHRGDGHSFIIEMPFPSPGFSLFHRSFNPRAFRRPILNGPARNDPVSNGPHFHEPVLNPRLLR